MRACIYARYSSDNQRDASIEDQIRLCREHAEKEDWTIVKRYEDRAISGASLNRPDMQAMLRDAVAGEFDVVTAEGLDRLSRDQEDIAAVFKRMQFLGIKIITLSEGEISELHVGLKGTMNALYLKTLAANTRRGLRGRVEQGKAGGGLTFGYDVVKRIDAASGDYVRGERTINEGEALIVVRICEEYANGASPKAIAVRLNKEGIPCPSGGPWGPSTINGNRDRGTGIINNEMYRGKLVWNRLRYLKDPSTGKRISRLNPQSEWITRDVPELRIVSDELWDRVRKTQGAIAKHQTPLWAKNRPKNLLSHLIKCGCCGGGCSMINTNRLGCSTSRNKGTCTNRLTINREHLETMVLGALRTHLMDEALCREFCAEYTRHMNELRMRHNASLNSYKTEYAKLERERQQIIRSIADGVPGSLLKDRAVIVQTRREELEALMSEQKEEKVLFHPNMAARYHVEIRNLLTSFNQPESRAEASTLLRSLIDRIVLTPDTAGERLTVDLVGDLAGILSIATSVDRELIRADLSRLSPEPDDYIRDVRGKIGRLPLPLGKQEAMVAGTGFEPVTFRL